MCQSQNASPLTRGDSSPCLRAQHRASWAAGEDADAHHPQGADSWTSGESTKAPSIQRRATWTVPDKVVHFRSGWTRLPRMGRSNDSIDASSRGSEYDASPLLSRASSAAEVPTVNSEKRDRVLRLLEESRRKENDAESTPALSRASSTGEILARSSESRQRVLRFLEAARHRDSNAERGGNDLVSEVWKKFGISKEAIDGDEQQLDSDEPRLDDGEWFDGSMPQQDGDEPQQEEAAVDEERLVSTTADVEAGEPQREKAQEKPVVKKRPASRTVLARKMFKLLDMDEDGLLSFNELCVFAVLIDLEDDPDYLCVLIWKHLGVEGAGLTFSHWLRLIMATLPGTALETPLTVDRLEELLEQLETLLVHEDNDHQVEVAKPSMNNVRDQPPQSSQLTPRAQQRNAETMRLEPVPEEYEQVGLDCGLGNILRKTRYVDPSHPLHLVPTELLVSGLMSSYSVHCSH